MNTGKVAGKCPDCDGVGLLPALGYEGLADDSPARKDVTRAFVRFCDRCSGTGKTLVDVPKSS